MYQDAITKFLICLYVDFDFEGAQQQLQECERVLDNDFFLTALRVPPPPSPCQPLTTLLLHTHGCVSHGHRDSVAGRAGRGARPFQATCVLSLEGRGGTELLWGSGEQEEFVENARLLIFETYCRIHQCIDLAMLADKLNMDKSAAETWVVNLIRNARLNAKIDSQVLVPACRISTADAVQIASRVSGSRGPWVRFRCCVPSRFRLRLLQSHSEERCR